MEKISFGSVVYTNFFPFVEEDCFGRAGYAFVLEDQGDNVLVAFLTSNPVGTVRVGALADGRVTNLNPHRSAVISKSSLVASKQQRVSFDHLLRYILSAAMSGSYGELVLASRLKHAFSISTHKSALRKQHLKQQNVSKHHQATTSLRLVALFLAVLNRLIHQRFDRQ